MYYDKSKVRRTNVVRHLRRPAKMRDPLQIARALVALPHQFCAVETVAQTNKWQRNAIDRPSGRLTIAGRPRRNRQHRIVENARFGDQSHVQLDGVTNSESEHGISAISTAVGRLS
jgi:hypothetical protein